MVLYPPNLTQGLVNWPEQLPSNQNRGWWGDQRVGVEFLLVDIWRVTQIGRSPSMVKVGIARLWVMIFSTDSQAKSKAVFPMTNRCHTGFELSRPKALFSDGSTTASSLKHLRFFPDSGDAVAAVSNGLLSLLPSGLEPLLIRVDHSARAYWCLLQPVVEIEPMMPTTSTKNRGNPPLIELSSKLPLSLNIWVVWSKSNCSLLISH